GGTGTETAAPGQPGGDVVNNPTLAIRCGLISSMMSTRRIGLCWEATRAPRWTRIPQAWAVQSAQAGLLRDRQQSEKSQGFGDRVPELSSDKSQNSINQNRWQKCVSFFGQPAFHAEPVQKTPNHARVRVKTLA